MESKKSENTTTSGETQKAETGHVKDIEEFLKKLGSRDTTVPGRITGMIGYPPPSRK
jgi:hypothetical protein